jgi:hypothetical protein
MRDTEKLGGLSAPLGGTTLAHLYKQYPLPLHSIASVQRPNKKAQICVGRQVYIVAYVGVHSSTFKVEPWPLAYSN